MSGLFSRKKKDLKIPSPPPAEELPSFPLPKKEKEAPKEELPKITPLEEHKRKAVEKEKRELSEREHLKIYQPIFVNVHSYKVMIDEINQLKNNLLKADDIVGNLEGFKDDQDSSYKKWFNAVKDIHEKLIYVDETLFKGR